LARGDVRASICHELDRFFFVALTGIRRIERKWDQRFESAFLQRRVSANSRRRSDADLKWQTRQVYKTTVAAA
jgi:hypothetical protein